MSIKIAGGRGGLSTGGCLALRGCARAATLPVVTLAATRHDPLELARAGTVLPRDELARFGVGPHDVTSMVWAHRWQVVGTAIVLHNAALTRIERERVFMINCGPRAVLTSFTAAAAWGLQGWAREEIHVLAPAGTARPALAGLRLHRTGDWAGADLVPQRRLHRLAPALVIAASSFPTARGGCGVLAAGVQQRLTRPIDLERSLAAAPRTRHRAQLLLAVADIAQGAGALSEIDFVRLCRRAGLPTPTRQAVRIEPSGRRRYLDVEWRLADGRIRAVEVDGAFHLSIRRWSDDQLRQNEVVIGGTPVLRFPSVVVRDAPEVVVDQLRRFLYA